MRFDFSNINNNNLVPAGTYRAELKRTKSITASTGTPGFLFIFEVMGPEEYAGTTLFHNMYVTKASMWRVRQVLQGFGMYTEDELNSPEFEFVPEDLIGAVVDLQVSQRLDNKNVMRNNVDQVMPVMLDYDDEDLGIPFGDDDEITAPEEDEDDNDVTPLAQVPDEDVPFLTIEGDAVGEVEAPAPIKKVVKKSSKNV